MEITDSPTWLTEKVAAVDYETYYYSTKKKVKDPAKEYSVATMSYWHYCHDPRFDAYRVSIVTNTGIEWVGHPKDAPWESIRDHVWVAHNTPFDLRVHERLQEDKIVPDWMPPYWGNTANLVAYHRSGRSLKDAVKNFFDVELDKTIRDVSVNGKHWEDFSEELKVAFDKYNLDDSRWTLKLWLKLAPYWPERERRVADLYDKRSLHGLHADVEGIKHDIDLLTTVMFEAEKRIPWKGTVDENGDEVKLLSYQAVCQECRNRGIEPPPSLKMTDEGLEDWEDKYGAEHKFVAALRDWRRANIMREKYLTILGRVRPTDNCFEINLTYFGARTGRSTGSNKNEERETKGANMLNMPRFPMYITKDWHIEHRKEVLGKYYKLLEDEGKIPEEIPHTIYMRKRIIPRPGKKFIIADLSQIEPRSTLWFARVKKMLDLIRTGLPLYDAHAIMTMGYKPVPGRKLKKDNAGLYATAKMRVIALYYGTAHVKFIEQCRIMLSEHEFNLIFDHPYTEQDVIEYKDYLNWSKQKNLAIAFDVLPEEKRRHRIQAWKVVRDFRQSNPEVCGKEGLWKKLQTDLEKSIGGDYVITLPNGRELRYRNVRKSSSGIEAQVEINGEFTNLYGGKLLENCLSGDTLVLSESHGWQRLDSVTADEKVWDGLEFVSHGGLVHKGVQDVTDCHGVLATPDHKFLTTQGWMHASAAALLTDGVRYQLYENHAQSIGVPNRGTTGTPSYSGATRTTPTFSGQNLEMSLRLRGGSTEDLRGAQQRGLLFREMPLAPESVSRAEDEAQHARPESLARVAGHEETMLRSEGEAVRRLRWPWNTRVFAMDGLVQKLLGGHGPRVQRGATAGPREQRRELRTWKLPLGRPVYERQKHSQEQNHKSPTGGSSEKWGICGYIPAENKARSTSDDGYNGAVRHSTEVYDLLNCGPRHRFVVRPASGPDYYLIAHNCIQSFAREIFVDIQLRSEDAGLPVVLDVYDECCYEVDKNVPVEKVVDIFTQNPSYAKTLPLACEAEEASHYRK